MDKIITLHTHISGERFGWCDRQSYNSRGIFKRNSCELDDDWGRVKFQFTRGKAKAGKSDRCPLIPRPLWDWITDLPSLQYLRCLVGDNSAGEEGGHTRRDFAFLCSSQSFSSSLGNAPASARAPPFCHLATLWVRAFTQAVDLMLKLQLCN